MNKNGTIKHGGSSPSWGNLDSNIIFPSALPRLKLFEWISLIPTYNSGIEQYFNYTKHFGKNRVGRGGLQMWKNSFCLLWPFFYLGAGAWFSGFFCYMILGKQGIGNVDYSKILLAWIVTSFLFFWSWELYLYTEHGSMGHSSILDLSFGWTGATFGSCYGLIPARLVSE